MESSTGFTTSTSSPSGLPDNPMPKVYTLPLMDMLVGAVLDKVAVPKVMEKTKSLLCRAPLPPVALYTASEKVTAKVELFAAKDTDVMTGNLSSFKAVSYTHLRAHETRHDLV